MNPMQIMSMLPQLRANPVGFLKQYGFNVPENARNPNDIIQHLMNSGQINQSQYDQARQMARQFGLK